VFPQCSDPVARTYWPAIVSDLKAARRGLCINILQHTTAELVEKEEGSGGKPSSKEKRNSLALEIQKTIQSHKSGYAKEQRKARKAAVQGNEGHHKGGHHHHHHHSHS
jgi:hypothetical protein